MVGGGMFRTCCFCLKSVVKRVGLLLLEYLWGGGAVLVSPGDSQSVLAL